LLSFVLYYKSKPILTDIGRFNYNITDEIGTYGYSAKAHNSLTIDGLDPQAGINNRKLPDFYRSSKVTTDYSIDSKWFEFIIEHNGFCRLFSEPVKHKRTFKLSNGYFSLEDNLRGKKKHQVNTYFHWAPGLNIENNNNGSFMVSTTIKQVNKEFHFSKITNGYETSQSKLFNANSSGLGWSFPNYGLKEKINSLGFFQQAKLPIINKYTLEWNL